MEMLLHVLTGTHIEPEINTLRELINNETESIKKLAAHVNKKEGTNYLPGFLVLQSWGLVFGSILENAADAGIEEIHANAEELKKKRIILITELEGLFKQS
jgi:hypothetical protein